MFENLRFPWSKNKKSTAEELAPTPEANVPEETSDVLKKTSAPTESQKMFSIEELSNKKDQLHDLYKERNKIRQELRGIQMDAEKLNVKMKELDGGVHVGDAIAGDVMDRYLDVVRRIQDIEKSYGLELTPLEKAKYEATSSFDENLLIKEKFGERQYPLPNRLVVEAYMKKYENPQGNFFGPESDMNDIVCVTEDGELENVTKTRRFTDKYSSANSEEEVMLRFINNSKIFDEVKGSQMLYADLKKHVDDYIRYSKQEDQELQRKGFYKRMDENNEYMTDMYNNESKERGREERENR